MQRRYATWIVLKVLCGANRVIEEGSAAGAPRALSR